MTRRVTLADAAWMACLGLACAGAVAATGQTAATAGRGTFFVTAAGEALVSAGLAQPAPEGAAGEGFAVVAPPGLRNVPNDATATSSPWIDSNAWRFARGTRRAKYVSLPPGAAPLAAAEAFAFDVEAILDPAPADVEGLGQMVRFLKAHVAPVLSARANVGVVESDSPLLPEVLNMLTRRNLLYHVVTAPDSSLDVTVQLGSEEFPFTAAVDPSEFAARVRAALGDDKRLVRVYGSNTTIVRLLGDRTRSRLILLNFSRSRNLNNVQHVRARVRGRHRPTSFAAFGVPATATLEDVRQWPDALEFTVPPFMVIAIVDLEVSP